MSTITNKDTDAIRNAFERLYAGLRPFSVQAADASWDVGALLFEIFEKMTSEQGENDDPAASSPSAPTAE